MGSGPVDECVGSIRHSECSSSVGLASKRVPACLTWITASQLWPATAATLLLLLLSRLSDCRLAVYQPLFIVLYNPNQCTDLFDTDENATAIKCIISFHLHWVIVMPVCSFISARQHSIIICLARYYAIARPSVCLSVRLSLGWIIQKRLKIGSWNFTVR